MIGYRILYLATGGQRVVLLEGAKLYHCIV